MIISAAPVRISFIGGGTDFSSWFLTNQGMVISTSINKYSYIMLNEVSPFRPYKYRLCYSQIEEVPSLEEIRHEYIREVFSYFSIDNAELFHCSDLPTSSGLGSSSTFLVALVEAAAKYKKVALYKNEILNLVWKLEHKKDEQSCGYQDAIPACYGGLNAIYFNKGGKIEIIPIDIPLAQIKDLNAHTLLFHTNIYRNSNEIASTYKFCEANQWTMLRMTEAALNVFYSADWAKLGSLIDQSWRLKLKLSSLVSSSNINHSYAVARTCGAFGGKLIGSGNGGCLMLIAPLNKQENIINELNKLGLTKIDFTFENNGVSTLFNRGNNELYI